MDASSSKQARKSKAKPRELLEYTWYIRAIHEDNTLDAGAICVHSDGLLVTVKHGISLPGFSNYPDIEARRQNEKFRAVEVITDSKTWEAFGLLLLKVKKKRDEEEEEFKAFPIQSNRNGVSVIDPRKTIPVHGFIFQDLIPFSYINGNTSYLYPNNLIVPTNGFFPVTYDGDFTGRTISSFTLPGTIWSPIDISNYEARRSVVGDGIYDACKELNGTIPLLQVSGLDVVLMDGQIGWPMFTEDNKLLLGLIFLSTSTHQFVIPAQFVLEVLRRYLTSRQNKK